MNVVLEIVSLAVLFLAGNVCGPVAVQMRDAKRAAAGLLIGLLATGAGLGLAFVLDRNLTSLDYAFWAGVYAFGFLMGWRAKRQQLDL